MTLCVYCKKMEGGRNASLENTEDTRISKMPSTDALPWVGTVNPDLHTLVSFSPEGIDCLKRHF